jgi:hypothetical protein
LEINELQQITEIDINIFRLFFAPFCQNEVVTGAECLPTVGKTEERL